MRFIEQLGLFLLTLLLAGTAVGCLIAAGSENQGSYAIAAGIFALAFVHLLVHSDRPRDR